MFRHLAQRLAHLRHSGEDLEGPAPVLDAEEIVALERELESLGSLFVPAASRERGWALLREEASRRASRSIPAGARTATGPRRLRLALVGALAVAAVTLGTIGVVNLREERQVASSSQSQTTQQAAGTGPATSQVTETTLPLTTDPGVTASSAPVMTTTPSSSTTAPTSTSGKGTTGSTTQTTAPATTTSRQVMAKEEKERQALAAADYLAQAVSAGDRARAQAVVADAAAFGLSEMLASLRNPVSHRVSLLGDASASVVKVILQFTDSVPTDAGASTEVTFRFLCEVRTSEDGALITAIYAAP